MDTFIARQAIFDKKGNVVAYELLYRSSEKSTRADLVDGDRATLQVLSDAITVFGLPYLTNSKMAFVNFTENLLLRDTALLASPDEVAVEILEDVKITKRILEKLQNLKDRGYTLVLDDYIGKEDINKLLPLLDIVKIDFMNTSQEVQERIADALKNSKVTLLAEKVETLKEYERAKELGYQLFQGYFFRRPVLFQKKAQKFSIASFNRLLEQVQKSHINFKRCSQIVHSDVALTYSLMGRANILQYYRGNIITSIQQALVRMGEDELRRWVFLTLARGNNITISDEAVKEAYIRGLFAEEILKKAAFTGKKEEAFIVGMFSQLPEIMGESMGSLLDKVELPPKCTEALLNQSENEYSRLLEFFFRYENKDPELKLEDFGINISWKELGSIYVECIRKADLAFSLR
ncbi:EAL and HDOD domain-containing protein [Acetivibrio ethanolgignens]|uniref:Diguanylate phosphodiesterase n=1 Tax=Acetivibrio ethanolgignens TaxID=290052 RepID=A0A0V8QCX2_9FIRM|nr:EAL domain-containing protein [Acetivibrio ethanolgignens]KSV58421.1 hypothetical protein ASU35_13130 [Acetivibrio ethanolgignens]